MKIRSIILIFCLVLIISSTSFAGDMLYHFMQAHQDYVVIGTVVDNKGNNNYTIEISELISDVSIRKDIPKKIDVIIENVILNNKDNVTLSLSKRGGGYAIENGFFKITTNNTDTLEVLEMEGYSKGELAAVELFLKSRGKIKDFYFTDDKTFIHSEPFKITENDICIYSNETGKILSNDFEKNEKYIINSNNINGIKLVIISIIIFILSQIIVLYAYTKMNPDTKIKEMFKINRKNKKDEKPEK